jgi:hypothetical protein
MALHAYLNNIQAKPPPPDDIRRLAAAKGCHANAARAA